MALDAVPARRISSAPIRRGPDDGERDAREHPRVGQPAPQDVLGFLARVGPQRLAGDVAGREFHQAEHEERRDHHGHHHEPQAFDDEDCRRRHSPSAITASFLFGLDGSSAIVASPGPRDTRPREALSFDTAGRKHRSPAVPPRMPCRDGARRRRRRRQPISPSAVISLPSRRFGLSPSGLIGSRGSPRSMPRSAAPALTAAT